MRLRRQPDALELVVRDDGAGLSDVPGSGVGLDSMRDRAQEVGGSCTTSSPAEGGTVVVALLPLGHPGGGEEIP